MKKTVSRIWWRMRLKAINGDINELGWVLVRKGLSPADRASATEEMAKLFEKRRTYREKYNATQN